MDINTNRARKSASPPSTSSSYFNVAAFDSMTFPVTGNLYPDYYEDNVAGSSYQAFPETENTQEEYYEELTDGDSQYPPQQLSQHNIQQQYQSTQPSSLNTPSIEVKFEDLYDNLHISQNKKSGRRLSSNIHSRRRAQNRASQRAFRERKEQHVKEVEAKLVEVEAKYESLKERYRSTKQELENLKMISRPQSDGGEGSRESQSNLSMHPFWKMSSVSTKAISRPQSDGGDESRMGESEQFGYASFLENVFCFDGDAGDEA